MPNLVNNVLMEELAEGFRDMGSCLVVSFDKLTVAQSSDVFGGTAEAVGVSVAIAMPLGLVVGLLTRSPTWDGIDMAALRPRP